MFAKSCFQRANRKTRFECLEGRRLMAGDVRAYVQDGTLHLNGDAAANWVEVQEISPAHFSCLRSRAGHEDQCTSVRGFCGCDVD